MINYNKINQHFTSLKTYFVILDTTLLEILIIKKRKKKFKNDKLYRLYNYLL